MFFGSSRVEAKIEQTPTGSFKVFVVDSTGRRWPYSNALTLESALMYKKEAGIRFANFSLKGVSASATACNQQF